MNSSNGRLRGLDIDAIPPPHDIEAEQCVLGSVLLEPTLIDRVKLRPREFHGEANALLWDAMLAIIRSGKPLDDVTLVDELRSREILDQVGGRAYVAELAQAVPTATNIEQYAAIVHKHSVRRHVQRYGVWMIRQSLRDDMPAGELVARIERHIHKLTNLSSGHTGGAIVECLADIEPQPIEWLWPGRIPLGCVTVLAGRPGEGKSFVSLDVAARVSTGSPWPDGEACERGSVLLLSAEDDPHRTIRPRLDAIHADAKRIHLLRGMRRIEDDGSPQDRYSG